MAAVVHFDSGGDAIAVKENHDHFEKRCMIVASLHKGRKAP
jgi:hypothetical protein